FPIALLFLLHFIRVAVAAWHSDPVPRLRDDDMVTGLSRLAAAAALGEPVSSAWLEDRLRPFVEDGVERREIVLHAVATLLRSEVALAGRLSDSGERVALSTEEALEHIRDAPDDDPDPVWIALTTLGRAQALA